MRSFPLFSKHVYAGVDSPCRVWFNGTWVENEAIEAFSILGFGFVRRYRRNDDSFLRGMDAFETYVSRGLVIIKKGNPHK